MRIAYLALQAPREGEAAYVHVQEVAEGLRSSGNTVVLYSPFYSSSWDKPLFVFRMLEHLRIQIQLGLKLRKFDLIYVRAHFMALPIVFLAFVLGIPVVHEVNGPHEDVLISYPIATPLRPVLRWMQDVQYKYANGLITVTPQLQAWLMDKFGNVPIATISNGANLQLFNPGRRPDPDIPRPYAVFVGSLAPWHGLQTLVQAAESSEWPVGLRLVIVGDGPEIEVARRAAEQNPRISVLGRRPYESIGSIIVGATVGLVTISDPDKRSRTGVAPIKLFEFLACAVPVVVSDLPGQSELVNAHKCGVVYRHDNPCSLASAVARIIADPVMARMMGDRGRSLVEKEYSWRNLALKTDKFLRNVVAISA